MRYALAILAALAACSPAPSLPDQAGGRDTGFGPFDLPAPPVQLNAVQNGRVEVEVGQSMQFRTRYSSSQGEVVELASTPPFIEYRGVEASGSGGQGASADYIFTFVVREPGEGVLAMRLYNQRYGGPPGYEVLNVVVVAR